MTVIDRTDELKDKINFMTQKIINQLESSQLEELNLLIDERQEFIQELVAIADRSELKTCLLELQQQDQRIMAIIQVHQENIRNTLGNMTRLSSYLKS